ncbi:DUF6527 family protein [Corallococcus sp. AB030]|uniref:DUF6527 family protein n=1 Tax=Corallococcus sp. AB030 TaxID=2316716 RepID=UPI0018F49102|nr:DUF6527 family protein [Corallococcus sp. AB030]
MQYIPEQLEPELLYVSLEYGTVAHLCCCGCGEEVVTPLTPTDWRITYDGQTISLWPSIGNWNIACRSHYVIDRGWVIEARPWSDKRIEAERRRDKKAKARYYGTSERTEEVVPADTARPSALALPPMGKLRQWLSRLLLVRKPS